MTYPAAAFVVLFQSSVDSDFAPTVNLSPFPIPTILTCKMSPYKYDLTPPTDLKPHADHLSSLEC